MKSPQVAKLHKPHRKHNAFIFNMNPRRDWIICEIGISRDRHQDGCGQTDKRFFISNDDASVNRWEQTDKKQSFFCFTNLTLFRM